MTYKNSNSSKSKIGQCYPIIFFSQKMISAKTCFKTYNQELLAIVKDFKTRRHYLKSCKYEVFIFTNHNSLCQFMNIKNLNYC